uniref:ST6 N-acetylgalactosaminide alpha-2,6-sialyltransferase 4 n=1 Tax=Pipistrellus kuhlii TaxID=59472 RepID=A0A7J7S3Z3_PIPKU|nr:ST6 N-acetylgalactosaminide alpha-2,6-sialyltransferase 4 [Pipistrellus kuhlii]
MELRAADPEQPAGPNLPSRTGTALLGVWGLRFSQDLCLDSSLYPPLPQFPWEGASSEAWDPALSLWVLTGAWLPPLPSPGDSSPPAAERQRQHSMKARGRLLLIILCSVGFSAAYILLCCWACLPFCLASCPGPRPHLSDARPTAPGRLPFSGYSRVPDGPPLTSLVTFDLAPAQALPLYPPPTHGRCHPSRAGCLVRAARSLVSVG